jgi:hypothetical protein
MQRHDPTLGRREQRIAEIVRLVLFQERGR